MTLKKSDKYKVKSCDSENINNLLDHDVVRTFEVLCAGPSLECVTRHLALRWMTYMTLLDIESHESKLNHMTTPSKTTPHHIKPHHTKSNHTTPNHTISNHTTPHHTSPHQTTPHHITPHHITPHHTTPHHTTLHHTT